jgi:ubiquinone/menaquinone biosynthesis C-methylase UbiE
MTRQDRAADPQSFDRFADDYDRFCDLNESSDWPWMQAAGVTGGGRALDVGCGAGRRTFELAEHYDEVVGIDLSEPLVNLAAARRPGPGIRYVHADFLDHKPVGRFDLVYSHTMLHHVPDLSRALGKLRSLVAPGGHTVLFDCVAPRPTPPAWTYRVGAVKEFPSSVRAHGLRDAGWLVKFQWRGPWLDHLTSDTYLSPAQFRQQYGKAFPGGAVVDRGFGLALVWQRPMDT